MTPEEFYDNIQGKGMSFPINLTGSSSLNSGVNKIRDALVSSMLTQSLEVVFNDRGSELVKALFELDDYILYDAIEMYVIDSLKNVSAIEVGSVKATPDEYEDHTINVSVLYKIKRSNIKDEYTYSLNLENFR